MIIIIVFLDFLYIFLNTGGRGRVTKFFLGLLLVLLGSQVNVGISTDISQLIRPATVELGGRGELGQGRPQGAHREVVAEAGGDGEVLLLLLLLHRGAGLGQLEAGEDRLGGSRARGVAAELRFVKLE